MSALDPHNIPGLVRSSSRPRVPLPCLRWPQPALPFAVSIASAIMLVLLAVVLFNPGAAQGQGQAPDTPSSVSVSRSDGALNASWPAVEHATSYHITYSSDGKASWSLAALNHPDASITISGVDNAKTYVVGVRARNDSGDSGWRNSPDAGPYTPPEPDPTPEPVRDGTSTVTATRSNDGTSADISWTAYNEAAFDYYRVVVCTDAQFDGASCSGTVYQSDAFYDINKTGPVTATGLDAADGYGVILQVWRTGGHSNLKFYATMAAPTPKTLSFGSTVADQSYTKDTAITTLNLPAATASTGSPSIAYTLTPTLPAGLSFDAAARTVSGTPTAAAASATYTYTAAATDYTSATLTFSIVVAEPAKSLSFGSSTVADQSYVKDTAIATLTLPQATGGSGTITYSLSPSLPNGLSFDASARTITGTPTATSAGATYRYSGHRRHGHRHAVLQHRGYGGNGGGARRRADPELERHPSRLRVDERHRRQRDAAVVHRRHRLRDQGPGTYGHIKALPAGLTFGRQQPHHHRHAYGTLPGRIVRLAR